MSDSPSTERDLGRVEGKLDLVLQQFIKFEDKLDRREASADDRLAKRIADNEQRHDAHDSRMTAIEKKLLYLGMAVAGLAGTGATAGAYASGLKAMVGSLIHGAG